MTRLVLLAILLQNPLAPPETAPALPPAPADSVHAAAAPGAPRPAAVRPLPDSAVAAIRADPAYRYDDPEAERPSLLDRLLRWIAEHVVLPAARGSATRTGQALWIAVAVLVILGVVALLFRTGVGGVFGRRSVGAADAGDPLTGVTDIAAVDLEALLASALARRDWRVAVRLRYLVALQRLDARGVVTWTRDKTNRAFVREATARGGADVGGAFGDATRAFEVVWYGGTDLDASGWARAEARFERFEAALAASPRSPVPA